MLLGLQGAAANQHDSSARAHSLSLQLPTIRHQQSHQAASEVLSVKTIYVVFGLPITRPGEREFLGAYRTRAKAQRFVDAQDAVVRENLRVAEIELDAHPPSDGFWNIPED